MQVVSNPAVRLYVSRDWESNSYLIKDVDTKLPVPLFRCCAFDQELEKLIPCTFSTDVRFEFNQHLRLKHEDALYLCDYCPTVDSLKNVCVFPVYIYLFFLILFLLDELV